jgi:putative membrane protein
MLRRNRPLQLMLVWLVLVWVIAAISPYNRFDWLLENLLVIIYGVILVATYRVFAFSNLSYFLFTVFITLHLVGGHYTYAETPVGYWIRDAFSLSRNPYDRIVHFAYGLLCAYPFREVLLRVAGVRLTWAPFVAVNMVLAFSGFFEVVEAVIAMIVSPELGDAYLGTQGDIWDAQRDMLAATVGATLAMAMVWLTGRRGMPAT